LCKREGIGHGERERPGGDHRDDHPVHQGQLAGVRKVRAHRFKELFGYQVLNAQRRKRIEQLLAEAGIEVRPALKDAGRDDWPVMSMPVPVPVVEVTPDPARTAEWFVHMASVSADSEREVEMRFASPLFREGLGYREDREAARFAIRWARGSTPGHVEADLLYFSDDKHDTKAGEPLVLVECKRLVKDENRGPCPRSRQRAPADRPPMRRLRTAISGIGRRPYQADIP
jgi:hypothetical protein